VSALIVLLMLAAPALDLRTWPLDGGARPTTDTVRRATDLTASAFGPGANGPFTIAVDAARVTGRDLGRTIARLREVDGVADVSEPFFGPAGRAAVFAIEATTAPQDPATSVTLSRVRSGLLPGMYVTGVTSYFIDVSDSLTQRLWLLIVVVTGLATALLAIGLGSPLAAVKSGSVTLLSVAATYGVLVAVFQWGWGARLLGLPGPVPLSSWAAVLLFVVLFALSVNRDVFDGVSRAGAQSRSATRPVVIIAAIAAGFALDPDVVVKMLCVGIVVGLLVDVLIVRMILTPVTAATLGAFARWTPSRDRIVG
jgi:RND superfamily putative drug exporter